VELIIQQEKEITNKSMAEQMILTLLYSFLHFHRRVHRKRGLVFLSPNPQALPVGAVQSSVNIVTQGFLKNSLPKKQINLLNKCIYLGNKRQMREAGIGVKRQTWLSHRRKRWLVLF
jgi:hypothetical protein